MKTPEFDESGNDDQTFAPFEFQDARNTEAEVIYLQFSNWDWFDDMTSNTGMMDDYYLNGYGVEGLIKATLFSNGMKPKVKGIDYNSESATCLIEFKDMNKAIQVAELAAQMINDPQRLRDAIKVAREQGFEDG